jgi:uncharacterized membrane protein YdfJ with MMPL/SSD domain
VLEKLADRAYRHPRRSLIVAGVVVALCGALGGPVAGKLSSSNRNFEDSSSQSVAARNLIRQGSGVNPDVDVVVLFRAGSSVRSAPVRARVEGLAAKVSRDPAVARVYSFYNTGVSSFVSNNGRSTYLAVAFKPISDNAAETAAKRLNKELSKEAGVTVGGADLAGSQIGSEVGKDLGMAEGLAFPILFVLLLLIFRSLVAALLPLLGGVVAILATFLGLRLVNGITPLSIFALNLTTGLGLGLAIDYNLFIISRYREEIAQHGAGREALVRTLSTAGRTAAFSGLTVAAALASLLVYPQPFLYSMGVGGIFVALFSVASALLVLPAVLALLGERVNALSPAPLRRSLERSVRPAQKGFWYRLSHAVMRRPVAFAVVSAAVMIALGIPFLGIKFTGVNASDLPKSASARQVSDALATQFPPNRTSPAYLAVEAPRSAARQVEAYAGRLRSLPGAAAVQGPQPSGSGLWRIDVVTRGAPLSSASQKLVGEIRSLRPPFKVLAGGETAAFVDQGKSLSSNLPIGLAILVATTLVLLFAMTGSVVLPLKSLVMNLLTLSATFGLLVLIFQDGHLQSVLRFTSQGALEETQPILLAAVAFALSTDYGVFLLTRIKELHDRGASNTEAVAGGLERTGRLVTSAALLFCIAVGAFSISKIVFIKELGLGMALAVILDATVVRGLLVPSLMRLLGEWNWWAPGPLHRLYERYGLHESAEPAPPAVLQK